MISVVIPLYNKEAQVAQTLASVFNQTYQEFEIVVVNDGSTDRSRAIVAQIQDSRIRLIDQENQGVSLARNRGIKEAKYDLIALLDADDEWKPEYLQTQVDLFRKYPECSVFVCNYEFRDSLGNVKSTIINKIPFEGNDGVLSNYFEVASCSHPPMWTSAIMVKKETIQSVGGFPIGIKSGEDLLTWAKLALKYEIAYSMSIMSFFRSPIFVTDRECRLDVVDNDVVHSELCSLISAVPKDQKQDFRRYIGRWNEMRTAIFLESGVGIKTILPLLRAIRFRGLSKKVCFFLMIIFLPGQIQKKIFEYKRKKQ